MSDFYTYLFGKDSKPSTKVQDSEKVTLDAKEELSEFLSCDTKPVVREIATMDCGGTTCSSSDSGISYSQSSGKKFKEEDHPRGGKGSKEGGKFVKSDKTIAKEDDLGSPTEKREERDKKVDPTIQKSIDEVKTMQAEYKKRCNQLMEYAGKMHGGFTDAAKSLSRYREVLKGKIKKLGHLGYEVTGSLTGEIGFKKSGSSSSNSSSNYGSSSSSSKPKVSYVSSSTSCGSC